MTETETDINICKSLKSLSILKFIVVGMLLLVMGIALVFMAIMDYLTIFLKYINSYVD